MVIGIVLTITGFYVYDNYKQPILDNVNQIKEKTVSQIQPETSNTPQEQTAPSEQPIQPNTDYSQVQQPIQQSEPIDTATLESDVHNAINDLRVQNGVRPLVYDDNLAKVARDHSVDMGINNYLSHDTQDGKTLQQRFIEAKIPCWTGGENIQQTYDQDNLAKVIALGWFESAGHKANLLNPLFSHEGIGVYVKSSDYVLITEDFC